MSTLSIRSVDDLASLQQHHDVRAAAFDVDFTHLPADPVEELIPDIDGTAPDTDEKHLLRVGVEDGEPVTAAMLSLTTADNLQTASLDFSVHPEHRGRGHARRFLDLLLAELTELGRPRVLFEAPSPWPVGTGPRDALLRALGAKPALRELRRTVDLQQHTATLVAPPEGYRVVQWSGRAPDDLVDDLAYLCMRMSTDAPMEDMTWEPEVWDAARYRRSEESTALRRRFRIGTAVVHETSNRTVGYTEIGVSELAPEVGYQWGTLVVPEHRGHGLGMVVKAHNHQQAAQISPQTRWINTWNASETNPWMVSVNERLGFEPRELWTAWQLDR